MKSRMDVRDETASLVEQMGNIVIDDNRKRINAYGMLIPEHPKLCILDSEVASGKTRGLINLINHSCNSSITFVEQIPTAEYIANESKAAAITSNDVSRIRDLDGIMVDETVIDHLFHRMQMGENHFVLTHKTLENILRTNDYQGIFNHFEGIFIDELFKSYHLQSFKWGDLRKLYMQFSLDIENEGSVFITSFIKDINRIIKDSDANEITVLNMEWLNAIDLVAIESELAQKITCRKQKSTPEQIENDLAIKLVRQLNKGPDHIYYLQKEGNYNNLVATQSYLPERRSCLVCSDNALKDSSMKAMTIFAGSMGIDIQEETVGRGDWGSHHIRWQIAPTGKDQAINEFDKNPQDYLARMNSYDKGLFILPKDISIRIDSAIDEIRPADTEDEIAQKNRWNKKKNENEIEGSTIHDLTSWGRHKGTNIFSNNDKVYIPTLFHKPNYATSAGWVAVSCKDGNEFDQDEYEKQNLELKGLYADIKNLIGRVKRTEDSMGDKVDVYICFPNTHIANEMKSLFMEDMPGCHIDEDETYWWKEPETAEIDDLLESIIVRLGDNQANILSKLVDDGKIFRNMRSRSPENAYSGEVEHLFWSKLNT